MAGPVVETKLFVPGLRRSAVARPRLIEHLSRGAESRLTLVCVPAGFGKTALLAERLADPLRRRLGEGEPGDSDQCSSAPEMSGVRTSVRPERAAAARAGGRVGTIGR